MIGDRSVYEMDTDEDEDSEGIDTFVSSADVFLTVRAVRGRQSGFRAIDG